MLIMLLDLSLSLSLSLSRECANCVNELATRGGLRSSSPICKELLLCCCGAVLDLQFVRTGSIVIVSQGSITY
jgi:hypothetical protein